MERTTVILDVVEVGPTLVGIGSMASSRLLLAHTSDTTITKVTWRVIEDFEVLTDPYRQLDYGDGAQRVRADVGVHLRRMLEVSNRTMSSVDHRRLLRAAGDAAQLAGWLAIDAQTYRQARGLCQLAASLAEKANDRALHAYSLGVISYIHLHAGDGHNALDVLDTARELAGRSVSAAVGSWISEAAGEAHGMLGNSRRGLAASVDAERVFDGVTVDNTPAWLSLFNAECHAARLKGRCLMRLGQPKDATRTLYEALTLLPATLMRQRAGTLIDLAVAYIHLHQIEQACAVASQADVLARRAGLERNRKRLREMLVGLMPWASQDCVQKLYRRVLLG
jgi:tetratricopeptide (TPR) repeat protein